MATPRPTPARHRPFDKVIVDGVPGTIIDVTYNVHSERVYGVRIEVSESELKPAEEEAA